MSNEAKRYVEHEDTMMRIRNGYVLYVQNGTSESYSVFIKNIVNELKTRCFEIDCKDFVDKKSFQEIETMDAIGYAENNKNETPILIFNISDSSKDVICDVLDLAYGRRISVTSFPENLISMIRISNSEEYVLEEKTLGRVLIYDLSRIEQQGSDFWN